MYTITINCNMQDIYTTSADNTSVGCIKHIGFWFLLTLKDLILYINMSIGGRCRSLLQIVQSFCVKFKWYVA